MQGLQPGVQQVPYIRDEDKQYLKLLQLLERLSTDVAEEQVLRVVVSTKLLKMAGGSEE